MSRKIRKYGDTGKFWRAEFSAVNSLGVREYQSQVFNDEKKTATQNKKDANKFLDECEKIWNERGTFENLELTFGAYAEMKKKTHFHEAVIKNGKKVSGRKDWNRCGKYELEPLVKRFGKAAIKRITTHDCEVYKLDRLNTPTQYGTDRSIASVHREMAMLRRIFNLAVADGVLTHTPKITINAALEKQRERILTAEEEHRLLVALDYRDRQNKRIYRRLRPLVITALNTACRVGELLKLVWRQVDFDGGVLQILETNSKTGKYREVPFNDDARRELLALYEQRQSDDSTVFGLKYYAPGFKSLLKRAEIFDARFHDLRHTATTNFVRAGMRTEIAMSITGHSTQQTFRRYTNLKTQDLTDEYKKYETFKANRQTTEPTTEAVN